MKKRLLSNKVTSGLVVGLFTTMCLMLIPMSAFAGTLDDVVNSNSNSSTESVTQGGSSSTTNSGVGSSSDSGSTVQGSSGYDSGEISNLMEAGQVSIDSSAIESLSGAKKLVGRFATIVLFITILFLPAKIVFDIFYLSMPQFIQVKLDGGQSMNGQQGGQQGNMQSGMGGYNSGMGGYNRGGYNSGMGGYNSGTSGYGQGSMGNQQRGMKVPLISKSAVIATSQEHKYMTYFKSMTGELIAVPILLVVAVSGVLPKIGLVVGTKVVDLFASMLGMI